MFSFVLMAQEETYEWFLKVMTWHWFACIMKMRKIKKYFLLFTKNICFLHMGIELIMWDFIWITQDLRVLDENKLTNTNTQGVYMLTWNSRQSHDTWERWIVTNTQGQTCRVYICQHGTKPAVTHLCQLYELASHTNPRKLASPLFGWSIMHIFGLYLQIQVNVHIFWHCVKYCCGARSYTEIVTCRLYHLPTM